MQSGGKIGLKCESPHNQKKQRLGSFCPQGLDDLHCCDAAGGALQKIDCLFLAVREAAGGSRSHAPSKIPRCVGQSSGRECGRLIVMRASEAEILIIPGHGGSGPDHWQSRWESKLPSARRVVQQDWDRPALTAWRGRIVEEVERAEHPVILVAHSLGVLAAAHSAPLLARGTNGNKVKGAFMVAPPSQNILSIFDAVDPAFLILPVEPLAFPTVLIASRDDKYSSFADSEALANVLGAKLVDAGFSGHINSESGHGPWPEGLMCFAALLKTL
jgi:uncharacterized protein